MLELMQMEQNPEAAKEKEKDKEPTEAETADLEVGKQKSYFIHRSSQLKPPPSNKGPLAFIFSNGEKKSNIFNSLFLYFTPGLVRNV